MDQSHTKRKYILSMHAKERYIERVQKEGKKHNKNSAANWVNQAIANGQLIETQNDGTVLYRFKQYVIVVIGNTIKTISYYNYQDVKPLKEDITQIIKKRLRKEIKPLVAERKQLLIKAHELDIEMIKTNSRTKQLRLQKDGELLTKEGADIRSQIKAIIDFAHKYGIHKQDIVLDTDLV